MTNKPMPPTNKELAERFGVSVRTVQRATRRDPRWWTERRRALREKAAALRATGMKWADVAAALGVTESSARALGKRGAGAWADSAQASPERDPNTADLFQKA